MFIHQGARIADRHVCISRWGSFVDESDPWSWKPESNSTTVRASFRIAQNVVDFFHMVLE